MDIKQREESQMNTENYKAATTFVEAIKTIAQKPDNLKTLSDYLSIAFDEWLKTFANTPTDLAAELKMFAEIETY